MSLKRTLTALLLATVTLALAVGAGEPRANAAKLNYHNGPVVISATAVFIFWGPSFANPLSPDHAYATALQAFRNSLGTSGQYNVITQYYQEQAYFMCRDTREAVTDPLGTGWWSNANGGEADAQCSGFSTTNLCGNEWSNSANKCVAKM
jgi:hypothetical protein